MTSRLGELYFSRELLWIWTKREVSIRYKQAFFGVGWAILQPLGLMLAFTLVARFLRGLIDSNGVPYPIFYYTALLPWIFFSNSVGQASPSMVNNLNLVTKTYFPREIIPIAKVGAAFFDFLVASILFVVMLALYRVELTRTIVWVPALLAVQIIYTLGIAFLASAITVKFRDLRFVVPMALQLLLFVTPIIYGLSAVPVSIRPLIFLLNPMAVLIESYRRVLLYGQPPMNDLPVTAGISVIVLVVGYLLFKRLETTFADII